MALSDKNIVITPNRGQSADPKVDFIGASSTLGPQTITLNIYPTTNGTLSFEGSAGQLFSISNSMTGTIYSVNDVSGIPSIEVLDTGLIKLAQYGGSVRIGPLSGYGLDPKLTVLGRSYLNYLAVGGIDDNSYGSYTFYNIGSSLFIGEVYFNTTYFQTDAIFQSRIRQGVTEPGLSGNQLVLSDYYGTHVRLNGNGGSVQIDTSGLVPESAQWSTRFVVLYVRNTTAITFSNQIYWVGRTTAPTLQNTTNRPDIFVCWPIYNPNTGSTLVAILYAGLATEV